MKIEQFSIIKNGSSDYKGEFTSSNELLNLIFSPSGNLNITNVVKKLMQYSPKAEIIGESRAGEIPGAEILPRLHFPLKVLNFENSSENIARSLIDVGSRIVIDFKVDQELEGFLPFKNSIHQSDTYSYSEFTNLNNKTSLFHNQTLKQSTHWIEDDK